MHLFFGFILALFVTMALTEPLTRLARRAGVLDLPEARKVHRRPIPRGGGLAMAVGVVIPVLLWVPLTPAYTSLLAGMGLLSVVGFLDDLFSLDWRQKFLAQLVAAGLVVLYGGVRIVSLGRIGAAEVGVPPLAGAALTIVAIVGVTNAVNLADGLDGLAGGMCLIVFATLGYLAESGGGHALAMVCAAMAGAIVGFLRFNTHPATIFMGDAGSYLLGFSAAAASLLLTQRPEGARLAPVLPLLILGVPILDTLMVMVERLARGANPFLADKRHLHHRLLRLGFGHKEAVTIIYVLHSLLAYAALRLTGGGLLPILAVLGLMAALMGTLYRLEARQWRLAPRGPLLSPLQDRAGAVLADKPFWLLSRLIPAYLLALAVLPTALPRDLGLISLPLAASLPLAHYWGRRWFPLLLRLGSYLTISGLVFYLYQDGFFNDSVALRKLQFGVLALMALLLASYVKFGEGRHFRVTPLDAITIALAIAIPTLPLAVVAQYHLGPVAAALIVLFLSFEAVFDRLGEEWNRLSLSVLASLAITSLRVL